MIINGTTVRAFGYLALSCFQAKYPNPNRNSFWQVAVSWEFFQILRALVLLIFAVPTKPLFVVVVAHSTHLDHLQISWHYLCVFLMLRSRSLLIIPKFQSIWKRDTTSSVKLVSDRMVRYFWEKRSSPGKGMLVVLL